MAGETRQRMVEAAAESLRVRGLAGTSFTDVLQASGAARGAVYHHFPGGKSQLAREAVTWTGEMVRGQLISLQGDGPQGLVSEFLTAIRPVIEQSAHGAGCAVAAGTVRSAESDDLLMAAANDALKTWVTELDHKLLDLGTSVEVARALSTLLIVFLEGTHVLCRAAGDLEPFDAAAPALVALAGALVDR
jgi:TetR/AcrR family transcriptional repressor of lmrAB and yxaGH operons